MNEAKAQLLELTSLLNVEEKAIIIEKVNTKNKENKEAHKSCVKQFSKEIAAQMRLSDQMESELVQLRYTCKKIEDTKAFYSRNRLQQAKNVVKLEEDIFSIEEEISVKKDIIGRKDENLRSGGTTSMDELFLELILGIGIDLIDKNEFKAVIKNKNEVSTILIDRGEEIHKITNLIWSHLK